MLLVLTLFFLGVILWAFRPGSRPMHDDASQIPFRNEQPAGRDRDDRPDRDSNPRTDNPKGHENV
ncbi:cbb3-type cytochrome oxidase subunit 3 [Oceaniovalibus guishaninsula]|uniref:cbb3-type cytochrome oxidase subunit 3 n=1 Tax=Oceaniovalibus guishaninsula TaxID=1046117 RepID=UPI003B75B5D5